MGYAQPAAQTSFNLKEHGQEYLGKLLLIWPTNVMRNVQTAQGICDTVVEADIAVIDKADPATGQPEYLTGIRLWWTVLVNQTKNEVGGKVLGRLGQGANTKGSPPWLLLDYTPQDAALAEQYEAAFPRNAPAQPSAGGQSQGNGTQPWQGQQQAPPPPPPNAAQAGWGAPAAAPPPPAPAPAAAATWTPSAPPAGSIDSWPEGLADFLRSKGAPEEQLRNMTQDAAMKIAATYQL